MDYFEDIPDEKLKHLNKPGPVVSRDIVSPAIIFIIIFVAISAGLLSNRQFLSLRNLVQMAQYVLYVLPIFMAVSLTNAKNGIDLSIIAMIYLCQLVLVTNPTPYFSLAVTISICIAIGIINGLFSKKLNIPMFFVTAFTSVVLVAVSFIALASRPYLLETYLPHSTIWAIVATFSVLLTLLLGLSQNLWYNKAETKVLPVMIIYGLSGVFAAFFSLNAVSFAPVHFSPISFLSFSLPMSAWLFASAVLASSRIYAYTPYNVFWGIVVAIAFVLVHFLLNSFGVAPWLYNTVVGVLSLVFIIISMACNSLMQDLGKKIKNAFSVD